MLPGMAERRTRVTEVCLALTVAVVLADSSVVTLALPSILREYDATVFGVSWVLTAFNVVLAALILPAVRIARIRPRSGWTAGVAIFVAASIACAASGSAGALIGARVVQAAGGALAVACAIELLARIAGSHQAAAPIWGTAGTIGIAVGPAIGGVLTQLLDWQSIFLLQIPLLLLIPAATTIRPQPAEPGPDGPLDLRPEVGLALIFGRADRSVVPARDPAHRGLGPLADRCGRDGVSDPAGHLGRPLGRPPGRDRRPPRLSPGGSPSPAASPPSASFPVLRGLSRSSPRS